MLIGITRTIRTQLIRSRWDSQKQNSAKLRNLNFMKCLQFLVKKINESARIEGKANDPLWPYVGISSIHFWGRTQMTGMHMDGYSEFPSGQFNPSIHDFIRIYHKKLLNRSLSSKIANWRQTKNTNEA